MHKFEGWHSKKCVCHEFVTNLSRIFARVPYFIVCLRLLFFGDFCKKSANVKNGKILIPCHFPYISDSFCFLIFRFSSSSFSSSLISSSITWLSSFLLSIELMIFADSIFAEKSRCE